MKNTENISKERTTEAPEQRLLTLWKRYGGSPLGRKLFSYMLGRTAPYSGSIKAQVLSLEPGAAQVAMNDRKKLRNHLHSIHAIALANLGEISSGLAMISALPPNTRAIVVNLEIEYLKKARGRLLASGSASPPEFITEAVDSIALASIKDQDGDLVSRVKVHWRLSPKPAEEKG